MAAKCVTFVLGLFLISTVVEGFGPNPGFFGAYSPFDFVAQNVPLPWNGHFPAMNPSLFPKIPSKDDIINANAQPGQQYQAVFMSSSTGEDPELVINHNGHVYRQKFPKTKKSSETPEILKSEFVRPPLVFPSFGNVYQFPDPKTIKDRVPSSPNEKFVSYASTKRSSYVNDNGVEKASGQMHAILNDNGNVKEQIIKIGD